MASGTLSARWDTIRTSLWFVPTICVLFAVILSIVMPEIDHFLDDQDRHPPTWIFAGSADGARSILSTVAGSLITIIGVLFSITILILQQASTQFTPRVMGNFMRHTGTQLTLGVYLATFLYSLLILRYVRGEDSFAGEFIPVVSVSMSLVLAAVCLAFLVYFVHHMASSLQASMVISNVFQELQQDVDQIYPEQVGEPETDRDESLDAFRAEFMSERPVTITAAWSGYLRSVDDDSIFSNVPDSTAIAILPQIGDFIMAGMPIVEISGSPQPDEDQEDRIRRCLILGAERSRYQDPLFSVRQLADIALKALSTSINDPTTAKNSIVMLGAALALLSHRTFPDRIRVLRHQEDDFDRTVHVWTNRPTYDFFVSAAFTEVRREASKNVAVTGQLLDTIGSVAVTVETSQRAEPLHQQIDEVLRALPGSDFSESDQQIIRERAGEARQRLPDRVSA